MCESCSPRITGQVDVPSRPLHSCSVLIVGASGGGLSTLNTRLLLKHGGVLLWVASAPKCAFVKFLCCLGISTLMRVLGHLFRRAWLQGGSGQIVFDEKTRSSQPICFSWTFLSAKRRDAKIVILTLQCHVGARCEVCTKLLGDDQQ